MIGSVARSSLWVVCASLVLINLRLAPEVSPRRAIQQLEQFQATNQIVLPTSLTLALQMNSAAASSLLIYNLALSGAAFCLSLGLLFRRDQRGSDK